MFYTLGQAAKATGISKPTLSRAIKSGKLSGQKQPDGSFLIDPAELHRVYAPVTATSNDNGGVEHSETPSNPKALQGRLEMLREERERERQQLQATIDDLRRRLDHAEAAREREADEREKAAAELRRLTLLLTHDRQPEAHAPEIGPAPAPEARALPFARWPFWFALALVATGAAAWFGFPRT